jgi:predicted enzyme related to lactoylglutathione lyase
MKTIEVISIPVSDQQLAKDFYLKLGFEMIVEAPMGNGETWVQLGIPGQVTSITLVTWFPNMPPGAMQGLVVKTEDIENETQELKAKGIPVGTIDNTPWGKFATVTDPDGNTLTLHQN